MTIPIAFTAISKPTQVEHFPTPIPLFPTFSLSKFTRPPQTKYNNHISIKPYTSPPLP